VILKRAEPAGAADEKRGRPFRVGDMIVSPNLGEPIRRSLNASGRIQYLAGRPLEKIPAGTYELKVTVSDERPRVTRTGYFTIMSKLITCLAVCLLASANAFANISYGNQRLDHVLYPKHPPKLVVAGEIREIKGRMYDDRELSFGVEEVILGDRALAHTSMTVPTAAFNWPEDLVPHAVGSFCILILDGKRLEAVAPAAKGRYRVATNQVEALRVLEEGIVGVLQSETSASRQRAMLLQLAPVLRRENVSSVIPFLKADDPWVRRAALAALIYAAEDAEYVRLAAADIKGFFADESITACLKKQKRLSSACEPAGKFIESYFFLESRSWRWGSRWNDEEAGKHRRIWKAILSTGEISAEAAKLIEGAE
jgi:hypothetical protein